MRCVSPEEARLALVRADAVMRSVLGFVMVCKIELDRLSDLKRSASSFANLLQTVGEPPCEPQVARFCCTFRRLHEHHWICLQCFDQSHHVACACRPEVVGTSC